MAKPARRADFEFSMSKIIVVTGANRGIGLALAQALGEQGHRIIATARNPETSTRLKVLPNVIGTVQAEMSDLKSLPRAVSDIYRLAPDGIDELWNVREVDGRNLTSCETNTSRKIQNARLDHS